MKALELKLNGVQWAICILVIIALIGGVHARAQSPNPRASGQELWQVDLRKFGYEEWTPGKILHLADAVDWIYGLGFSDNDDLAVSWLTLDDPGPKHLPSCVAKSAGCAPKVQSRQPEPSHLHVLVLDATTGRMKSQWELPTPSYPVRLLTAPGGKFIVCSNGDVQLLSAKFELLNRINSQPSDANGCTSQWRRAGTMSPSGLTLFVSYGNGQIHSNELLDTSTLAIRSMWSDADTVWDVSDHGVLVACGEGKHLCIRTADQGEQPLQSLKQCDTNPSSPGRLILFLNDDTFLIRTNEGAAVCSTDDVLLYTLKFPADRFISDAVSSLDGDKFAVLEDRLRGLRIEQLDMYPFQANDSVAVYRASDGKMIYEVKVEGTSPWTPWNSRQNQPALSPDGRILAIQASGLLKVYRIPTN